MISGRKKPGYFKNIFGNPGKERKVNEKRDRPAAG